MNYKTIYRKYYLERNILHLKEKNKAVIPCATSMWVISKPYNDRFLFNTLDIARNILVNINNSFERKNID